MISLAVYHGICPGMAKILVDTVTYCIDTGLKEKICIDRCEINTLSPLFHETRIYEVFIITNFIYERGIVNKVLRHVKIQLKGSLIFRVVFLYRAVEDIRYQDFKIRFSLEKIFNRHFIMDLSCSVLESRRTVGALSFYLRTCRREKIT